MTDVSSFICGFAVFMALPSWTKPKVAQPISMRPTPRARTAPAQLYACLPRAALKRPPIRHRSQASIKGLSPLEFAIAGACAILGRRGVIAARHAYALESGKRSIKNERRNFPPKDVVLRTHLFRVAGASGYLRGQESFDARSEATSRTISVSRSRLLAVAGVARNGKNIALLDAAVTRLTEPVGKLPPVLNNVDHYGLRLRLTVNGYWLPRSRFARVPWPPPTVGATVLALFLFVTGIDLRDEAAFASIRFDQLCRRLGIPMQSSAHAERSLDNALAAVNRHLAALDHDALELEDIDMPIGFRIVVLDDGTRIRFRPVKVSDDHSPVALPQDERQQNSGFGLKSFPPDWGLAS